MERLLRDTFHLMFNLDLLQVSCFEFDRQKTIFTKLILRQKEITVCIFLHITPETANLIANRVGVGNTDALPVALSQDIACEIVNIVGNRIRTELSQRLSLNFEFGLPNTASEGEDFHLDSPVSFNMNFQITPETPIELGFICGFA